MSRWSILRDYAISSNLDSTRVMPSLSGSSTFYPWCSLGFLLSSAGCSVPSGVEFLGRLAVKRLRGSGHACCAIGLRVPIFCLSHCDVLYSPLRLIHACYSPSPWTEPSLSDTRHLLLLVNKAPLDDVSVATCSFGAHVYDHLSLLCDGPPE